MGALPKSWSWLETAEVRVLKCLCMASLVQGPQVRLLTTSHCHLFWPIELTAEPLEGMAATLLSPPSSMHNTREAS